VVAACLALGGCSMASSPRNPSSPTVLPTTSSGIEPTPAPGEDPPTELPAGLPPNFGDAVDAADVPVAALIPLRGTVTGSWYGTTPEGQAIVVAWAMPGDDPLRRDLGVAAWRRFDDGGAPWRPVWGEAFPERRAVLGIEGVTADLTDDGADDVLLFAATGGSGACGSYTGVELATGRVILERPDVCDTRIAPGADGHGLTVTAAVFRDDDPHCCPSATRTTTLRYAGDSDWAVVDETVEDA
jgi:hypothetical protein